MPHTKYGGWGRNMKYGKKSGGSDVIVIFAVLAALALCVALMKEVAQSSGAAQAHGWSRFKENTND